MCQFSNSITVEVGQRPQTLDVHGMCVCINILCCVHPTCSQVWLDHMQACPGMSFDGQGELPRPLAVWVCTARLLAVWVCTAGDASLHPQPS